MNTLQKLQSIVDGWTKYAFPTDTTEQLAKARAYECADCKHAQPGVHEHIINDRLTEIEGLTCTLCHCPLSAKVRSKAEKCPIVRW